MNEIEQAQQEVIADFDGCVDWEDRYQQIIDLGKEHPDIPDEYKVDRYRVKGCQSTVYLHASMNGDRIHFQATSDAMIVKGLVSLLMHVYNNRTPQEILSTPLTFIKEIGLSENLSQGRANGLASMIQQINLYAQAFAAMQRAKT